MTNSPKIEPRDESPLTGFAAALGAGYDLRRGSAILSVRRARQLALSGKRLERDLLRIAGDAR
jgi:hypothetical protein